VITSVDFSALRGHLHGISDHMLDAHLGLYRGYVAELNAIETSYPMTEWTPAPHAPMDMGALLGTPVASLALDLADPLAGLVARVIEELQGHVPFTPTFRLGDGDFWTGDRSVSINLPWFLANGTLWRLAQQQAETAYTPDQVLRCLRHEVGHAVGYAYELWKLPEWGRLFGDFTAPYRDEFSADRRSEDHVEYLTGSPAHYAQKHPDEDWAETFACWFDPDSGWREKYAAWPVALAKLEAVDRWMRELRGKAPVNLAAGRPVSYRSLRGTVRRFLGPPRGVQPFAGSDGWSEHSELLRREPRAWNAVALHELYFGALGGSGGRPPELLEALAIDGWGSLESWLRDLRAAAGSTHGWALTVWDVRAARMRNVLVEDHHHGVLAGCPVLLALDCWEHAYAADYGTRKDVYLGALMRNLDWEVVLGRLPVDALQLRTLSEVPTVDASRSVISGLAADDPARRSAAAARYAARKGSEGLVNVSVTRLDGVTQGYWKSPEGVVKTVTETLARGGTVAVDHDKLVRFTKSAAPLKVDARGAPDSMGRPWPDDTKAFVAVNKDALMAAGNDVARSITQAAHVGGALAIGGIVPAPHPPIGVAEMGVLSHWEGAFTAGVFTQHNREVRLSPSVAETLREAVAVGSVSKPHELSACKTVLHEFTHAASRDLSLYEGTATPDGTLGAHASLQEAATELIAQHYVRDFAKSLGLAVNVPESAPVFGSTRIAGVAGPHEEVEVTRPVAYEPQVRKFGTLVTMMDRLPPTAPASDVQEHAVRQALTLKGLTGDGRYSHIAGCLLRTHTDGPVGTPTQENVPKWDRLSFKAQRIGAVAAWAKRFMRGKISKSELMDHIEKATREYATPDAAFDALSPAPEPFPL
jgi:hypothetical protein